MAQTNRTEVNRQFQAMGESFIADNGAWGRLHTLQNARGCLEQLGRMVKMGLEADTIIKAAKDAADALTAGHTVKQSEEYLRHGRITGEWDESLLTATREAATSTAKPIEGLSPADLIAIEALLRDNAAIYNMLAEDVLVENEPKRREGRKARMAEMYADKVKAAFEAMTGHIYPQHTEIEAR